MPFIGLIKNFKQFRLFFSKIEKIAYTRNGNVASMLDISRRWPVVVYVDSDDQATERSLLYYGGESAEPIHRSISDGE